MTPMKVIPAVIAVAKMGEVTKTPMNMKVIPKVINAVAKKKMMLNIKNQVILHPQEPPPRELINLTPLSRSIAN